MSELDSFIVLGHRKVMDHYRRLLDTASSEAERARFEQRIAQENGTPTRKAALFDGGERCRS